MKKTIITLSILICSLFGYSQNIGIKLSQAQDFTIIPAYKDNADSVAILQVDRSYDAVTCVVQFYKAGVAGQKMPLILWTTFQNYADVTDAKIISRVKNKLNIP
jgi:hypothetical protein